MPKRLHFNQSVLLAPMAGVNDPIFRRICKQYGADLTYSEMVSATGLSYQNSKSFDLLYAEDAEKPLAIQLFGKDPAVLAAQAAVLEEQFADSLALIDINMGCPTKKIAGQGEGAALMKNPKLAEAIIQAVVKVVSLPVTVKFRRGFAEGDETAIDFARMAEAAGAAAVAVHGRWAVQMYSGSADKELIGRIKRAVNIPVIASGDVYTVNDICYYLHEQKADAVMVARGAQGNPWLFAHAKNASVEITLSQRVSVAREHLLGLAELFPHRLPSMRKHIAWYFKGIRNAVEIRRQVNLCVSLDDYLRLLNTIEAEKL